MFKPARPGGACRRIEPWRSRPIRPGGALGPHAAWAMRRRLITIRRTIKPIGPTHRRTIKPVRPTHRRTIKPVRRLPFLTAPIETGRWCAQSTRGTAAERIILVGSAGQVREALAVVGPKVSEALAVVFNGRTSPLRGFPTGHGRWRRRLGMHSGTFVHRGHFTAGRRQFTHVTRR